MERNKIKNCGSEKILNTNTNRCVLKTGVIGRRLLKENKCDAVLQIYNQRTNRCVKKSGRVGKQLLNEKETIEKSLIQLVTNPISVKIPVIGKKTVKVTRYRGYCKEMIASMLYLFYKHPMECLVLPLNLEKSLEEKKYDRFIDFSLCVIEDNITTYSSFWTQFLNCNKNSNVRFIIFPLTFMNYNLTMIHTNMMIYDKHYKILERFEPHGFEFSRIQQKHFKKTFIFTNLDDAILNLFEQKLKKKISYYKPSDICPNLGIQVLQEFENTKLATDPGGFCLVWSMWYAHLRLTNPNVQPKKLYDETLKNLKRDYVSLTEFIRNYAEYIKILSNLLETQYPLKKIKHFSENEDYYYEEETDDED